MTTRGSRNSPGLLPLKDDDILENAGLCLTYLHWGIFFALSPGQSQWRDFRQLWIRDQIQALSQDLNPVLDPTHSERTTDTCDAGLTFPFHVLDLPYQQICKI